MNKCSELIESWINGNREWVKNEIKNLSRIQRVEFLEYLLTNCYEENFNYFSLWIVGGMK